MADDLLKNMQDINTEAISGMQDAIARDDEEKLIQWSRVHYFAIRYIFDLQGIVFHDIMYARMKEDGLQLIEEGVPAVGEDNADSLN